MSVAALERAKLLSGGTNLDERRLYVEQLLTLPAYKDPQLTAYFAASISRHFSEVEDLQDQAVDAVLDLCEDEDEATRISGIKALAQIGREEPRWVKGNTGVLLQLLESPPSEVKHVRQALFDLLGVSATDVLSVMADDCKGVADETGAARRNVLDFLQSAKEQRAEIMESGKNVEAEKAFAEGFYEVMETTAIAETRRILGLLLPLSTISGKNATPQATGKFAKALTRCLHPSSSVGLTTPLLRLWAELDKRNPRLDPRWTLYFLADHGAAVVSLLAEKDDVMARDVLLAPVRDLRRLLQALDQRASGDLDERKLIPAYAKTILGAALRLKEKPSILEVALYPVYEAVTANRSTRDTFRDSKLRRDLEDLWREARTRKKEARDKKDEDLWRNIWDMAETLADRDLKPINIRPTWLKRDPGNPDEAEPKKSAPQADSTKQAGPIDAQRNGMGTSTVQPVVPATTTTVGLEAGRAQTLSEPSAPVTDSTSNGIQTDRTTDLSASTPTASTGFSILARAKQQDTFASSSSTPPPTSAGLSIRARATQTVSSRTMVAKESTPDAGPSTSALSVAPRGLSIRSAATARLADEPGQRSLLSRLSSSDLKRPREPESDSASQQKATSTGRGDLASRLGIPVAPTKRIRAEPMKASISGTTPLLARMPGNLGITPTPAVPSPPAFSIKNHAASANGDITPANSRQGVASQDDGPIIRKGRGFASRQS